jgi:two-component system NtrC family sensor kinase
MARKQQPERVPVALREVVSAALDLTGYALKTSGVEVTLDLDARLPPVLADPDQLHQVFMNLIINAQHALQERPLPRELRLTSRWDAGAGVVRIEVIDNGLGIPAAILNRIFEPYFTTKPSGAGTGVGLAVCLGIVEAHGGTLSAESREGHGTVFTVQLPAAVGHEVSASEAEMDNSGAGRYSVLVIDDETEVREMVVEVLVTSGHHVAAAASGEEALQRLSAERFDVIMTDIRMPGLDGIGLYGEIERRWPERAAQVVFMSGDTLTSNLREFAEKSGRPVIEKPFLPSDVRRVVGEVVGG